MQYRVRCVFNESTKAVIGRMGWLQESAKEQQQYKPMLE